MKSALVGFCILFSAHLSFGQASENKDFRTIRQIMAKQEAAWNNGDIEAFMVYYWQSEDLQFIGARGPTYGWRTTLENYRKNYPNREAMGTLHFDILKMNRRSRKVITLVGKFTLQRTNDQPSGYFLLVWQKIRGQWRIVADFTA